MTILQLGQDFPVPMVVSTEQFEPQEEGRYVLILDNSDLPAVLTLVKKLVSARANFTVWDAKCDSKGKDASRQLW